MEIQTDFIDLEDARVYYEEAGRGFPLVLVHSAVTDSHMWDDQFTVFAREYRTIRYDLRGFGRTVPDPVPFSHVNDIHVFLRLLEIERVFLVGCGLGAHTILDFALSHPRMPAGLVLVSAAPSEKGPQGHCQAGETGSEILFEEPDAIRRLGQVRIPTIVITGELDTPEVARTARLLCATIPDAIKANLAGAARLPNMERPTQFNRIVLTFLDWVKSRWEASNAPVW
jgi:pimeloyl-ACP methyl ester carboxylesterase